MSSWIDISFIHAVRAKVHVPKIKGMISDVVRGSRRHSPVVESNLTTMSSLTTRGTSIKDSKSLDNQDILSEEEYTAGLERIIARDFFPTLHHLQATNEYLSALESEDVQRIDLSVRTLRDLGPTPIARRGMETPLRTPARRTSSSQSSRSGNKRKYEEIEKMSLDEYQARFTSEDNASFTEVLDDDNRKRKEMYKWAWDAEEKAANRTRLVEEGRKRMLLEGGGESDDRGIGVRPGVRGRIEVAKPDVLLITQGSGNAQAGTEDSALGEGKTVALVEKEGKEEKEVMAPTKDTRSPFVSTWKFKVGIDLLFLLSLPC